ncbi:hypothetical protein [Methyloversatilis sp.]|uniref:hypothetical protein n=2 Tax=Methyloversatilis sp. TaxID=2569862 RepID=UPI002734D3D7|nr:hypothetical protein [Methyloversatilis sp.]MDP3453879.1 hypothetical protein [Methyloversatilis sp.]
MTFESSRRETQPLISMRGWKLLGSLAVAMLLCCPRTGASAEEPQACLWHSGWRLIYGASHPEVFDAFIDVLNANPADPWTYVLDPVELADVYYHWGGGIQYSLFATLYSDQSGGTSHHRPTCVAPGVRFRSLRTRTVVHTSGSLRQAPSSQTNSARRSGIRFRWPAATSSSSSRTFSPDRSTSSERTTA